VRNENARLQSMMNNKANKERLGKNNSVVIPDIEYENYGS
jgi:hypothetical protein